MSWWDCGQYPGPTSGSLTLCGLATDWGDCWSFDLTCPLGWWGCSEPQMSLLLLKPQKRRTAAVYGWWSESWCWGVDHSAIYVPNGKHWQLAKLYLGNSSESLRQLSVHFNTTTTLINSLLLTHDFIQIRTNLCVTSRWSESCRCEGQMTGHQRPQPGAACRPLSPPHKQTAQAQQRQEKSTKGTADWVQKLLFRSDIWPPAQCSGACLCVGGQMRCCVLGSASLW